MVLLFFMIMVIYAVPGSLYARRRYAIESEKIKRWEIANPQSVRDDIISRAREVELSSWHSAYCNYAYSSLRKNGCDCPKRKQWLEAKAARVNLDKAPRLLNPVPVVATWPLIIYIDFLKSGKAELKEYDPVYVKHLEESIRKELS